MATWGQNRLGDLVETQKGYAFKSGWYSDAGRPIVKVSDFTTDSVDSSSLVCIPEEIAADYIKYELKIGDVVVQTVGSWPTNPASVVGKCVRIPSNAAGALLNQNAVKLSPTKDLDALFLFYLLRSDDFKTYIIGTAQGAASQAAITLDAIRGYEFVAPPLPVQRRIAGILSAYDVLMENSQRRIRILESMARALYREWFIHFRYPGSGREAGNEPSTQPSGHPSPSGRRDGDAQQSPSTSGRGGGEGATHSAQLEKVKITNGLPDGWEVRLVKDILARRSAGMVYRETDVKPEGVIQVLDQSTDEFLGFHDNKPDHCAVPSTPMAIFGDHTCKMQLLIEPFSIGPNVVPFTAVDGLPTAYVFYAVNSLVQTQEYKRHWAPLNAKEIVVADPATAQSFASMIQPMLVAQNTLKKSIRNLRRTRDLLLPRLLSGQVDITK